MATVRFFSTILALLVAIHFAWSAIIVGMLRIFYEHRIINVRKIDNVGLNWENFTTAFVSEAIKNSTSEKIPLAMFVGSSVTYGFPWPESVIYTKLVARELPDWAVVNLSIPGVGMRAMTDFATCALTANRRPSVLIVEIPLVNSTSSVASEEKFAPRDCLKYGDNFPGYWPLVLFRRHGFNWISIFWDENAYKKPDVDLIISPLPPDYFANKQRFSDIEKYYIVELKRFLSAVSVMGDKVFVYVSPIYTIGIQKAGGDQAAVEYQIALTNKICLEYKNVTCLDSSIFNERPELFYNLTHLNHRGHRALAQWFEPYIASQRRFVIPQIPPPLTN
jgi:hypothetical protein